MSSYAEHRLCVEKHKLLYHLQKGHTCALLGCPGTGKTTLAAQVVSCLKEDGLRVAVAGSTGAAVQPIGDKLRPQGLDVKVQTVHSLLHFDPPTTRWVEAGMFEKVQKKASTTAADGSPLRRADVLVIEEISMLTGNFLRAVDVCTRVLRKRPGVKFGGLALLLVGDFRQLPPVCQAKGLLFQHPLWNKWVDVISNLDAILRQEGDSPLKDIVLSMSHNRLTPDQIALLHTRVVPQGETLIFSPDYLPQAMRVFDLNGDVNEYNRRVAEKARQSSTQHKRLSGRWRSSEEPCEKPRTETLFSPVVFLGAKVVLTSNVDVGSGLANGTMGTVTGFPRGTGDGSSARKTGCSCFGFRVSVETDGKETVEIGCHPLHMHGQRYHHIPLRLAHACTVHKLQGLTSNGPLFYMSSRKTGGRVPALYVVCSRATRLDLLHFAHLPSNISRAVDPAVVKWYGSLAG